jgi:hypothetical protein
VSFLFSDLGPKQLGLLREVVPRASRIGLLINPHNAKLNAAGAASRRGLGGAPQPAAELREP